MSTADCNELESNANHYWYGVFWEHRIKDEASRRRCGHGKGRIFSGEVTFQLDLKGATGLIQVGLGESLQVRKKPALPTHSKFFKSDFQVRTSKRLKLTISNIKEKKITICMAS